MKELPQHILVQLHRFFEDYNVLEGKKSEVADFYDQKTALEIIRAARKAYELKKR